MSVVLHIRHRLLPMIRPTKIFLKPPTSSQPVTRLQDTLDAAKKAAKRGGVFLGAWVDRTLRDAATDRLKETPVPAIPADDVMTLLSELTSMEKAKGGRPEKTGETTEPVKVDQLSKRGFFSRMFGG